MGAKRALSTCWIVTDGKAGMESQCLGLAEALGLDPIVKRVTLRTPWRQLSPYLRLGHRHAFTRSSDALSPPWPDLLIATGRHSVAASLHVRQESRHSGQPTMTVQIQDPVIAPSNFDLVVVPGHDRLTGANVVQTIGALHRVTPAKLRAAAAKLEGNLKDFPRPYIGVLIGGPNAAYRFGEDEMRRLSVFSLHRRGAQASGI
jgi:mitochondrial fission protein ELM1